MSTKKESIYLSGWSRSKTGGFALLAVALLLAAFAEPAEAGEVVVSWSGREPAWARTVFGAHRS